jgi:hypothetical protein
MEVGVPDGVLVGVGVIRVSGMDGFKGAAETLTFPMLKINPMMVNSTVKIYKQFLCDMIVSLRVYAVYNAWVCVQTICWDPLALN